MTRGRVAVASSMLSTDMPSQPVFDHFLDRLTTSFFELFLGFP